MIYSGVELKTRLHRHSTGAQEQPFVQIDSEPRGEEVEAVRAVTEWTSAQVGARRVTHVSFARLWKVCHGTTGVPFIGVEHIHTNQQLDPSETEWNDTWSR
jgi:hypothetical protein